jgi:hypothetical protein
MGNISFNYEKDEVIDYLSSRLGNLPTEFRNMIEELKEVYGIQISIYTPVGETMDLVSHHVFVDTGPYSFFVDNEMMYFPYVIKGTPEHQICPLMPAYSLYWEGLGHPLPIGRCVTHPGTAPQDYMEMSFDAADAEVDRVISEFGSWLGGE